MHGRADLLGTLLDALERDMPDARVVMLGDLNDRGPDTPGVVRLARDLARRFPGSEILQGNHEDWWLSAVDGNAEAAEQWLTWGGEATCRAYGVDPQGDRRRLADAFAPHADDLAFLRARPRVVAGSGTAEGYLFVHAGVDPLAPLNDQDGHDLIWMREPFLSWPHALKRRVVHGHTIAPRPQERVHRIGIDTGAYASGELTALVLDGGPPRYLSARADGVRPVAPDREASVERGAVPGRR